MAISCFFAGSLARSPAGFNRCVSPVSGPLELRARPDRRPARVLEESPGLHARWARAILPRLDWAGDEPVPSSACPMHWRRPSRRRRSVPRDLGAEAEDERLEDEATHSTVRTGRSGVEERKSWARHVRGAVRSCAYWSGARCRAPTRCVRAVSRICGPRSRRTACARPSARDTRASRKKGVAGVGRGGRARPHSPIRSPRPAGAVPARPLQPASRAFAIARIWISSVPA